MTFSAEYIGSARAVLEDFWNLKGLTDDEVVKETLDRYVVVLPVGFPDGFGEARLIPKYDFDRAPVLRG
jgi:hypothetical protein